RSVADINRERATHLVESIGKALGPLDDKVVAVLGLAFKPNTDDMREAKSVEVIHLLHQTGARVRAYDPVAMDNARPLLPAGVAFASSPYEAAQGADAAVLITEWNEFKYLNLERLRGLLRRPVIFDGRNLYEPERMRRLGYVLHFASPASPIDYLELPIQTLKVGSLGTHKALGLAKARGAKLLLASTSEVYGDPLVHPQREDYWGNVNPVGPRGVYDEAK